MDFFVYHNNIKNCVKCKEGNFKDLESRLCCPLTIAMMILE